MNCEYCKEKLSSYIDNELSPKGRLTIEEHLQKCPSCTREAKTLKQVAFFMGSVPEETPSQDFVLRTVKKAAIMRRRSLWNKSILDPALSFIRNAITFVFAPAGDSSRDESNLSSYGYLRTFDDTPPGSFADVYLTVIQGGSN